MADAVLEGPEWPERLPMDETEIPVEVRRFLTQRVLDEALALYGGWKGVIEKLYRGQTRTAVPGGPFRLSYMAEAGEIWPFVVSDARQWMQRRNKA